MRKGRVNVALAIVALGIATVLWGMAHGTTSHERGYDIPVVFTGVPDRMVITDQSVDAVNVRLLGSRAAMRNLSPTKMEYRVDVSGAKPGVLEHKIENFQIEQQIDLPRGVRIVSRSPARLQVKFERRGKKAVGIRADLEGAPAEGFAIKKVVVEPPRVWLVGARSAVLRLTEVVTEAIDVTDIKESAVREVGLSLGSGRVWMEEKRPVTVHIEVEALVKPGAAGAARGGA